MDEFVTIAFLFPLLGCRVLGDRKGLYDYSDHLIPGSNIFLRIYKRLQTFLFLTSF